MIPVRLKIEGFLSYRQTVELDFTGFSLACISGPNGAGKSSLLDAITWALFGQARKRDESIINNHPTVEAAEVVLDFDYEHNRYRVQRTNPRGKTSAVEFFIRSEVPGDTGRWKTLTERTLRETDKMIVDTLRMDYETFTNASFFLQGKADQFAIARPADRKRILSNILGLEVWETYREAASRRRRQQEKAVKELDGRLNEIQTELDEEAERKSHLADLQERLTALTEQRQERAEMLENVRRLQAAFEEQKKRLSNLQNQLEQSLQNRDRILETLEARREEKELYAAILADAESIEAAYEQWQETRQELEAIEAVAEQFRRHEALRHEPLRMIQSTEDKLTHEKENLVAQQAELVQAQTQAEDLKQKLSKTQAQIADANEKLAQRQKLEDAIRQLQADQAEAKAENPRLKEEGLELGARIDQLKGAREAACPICGQSLSTEDREDLIRSLTKDLEDKRERYRVNNELLKGFTNQLEKMGSQLADLSGVEAQLRQATRLADQLNLQLENLHERQQTWEEEGKRRLQTITETLADKSFAQDAREGLEKIDAELEQLGYDLSAHEKLREAEQASRRAEADIRQLEQARAALAPIQREIAGLEDQLEAQEALVDQLSAEQADAAAAVAAMEVDLPDPTDVESKLHDIQEQENRLRMEVGGARQKVAVLETLKTRKAALVEEREGMTQQIVNLKQLERAFGKDGVPALLIEQALPEIEETTNNLLSRLTNGRMSFSFMTQREYKDTSRDDLKETLDMVISDSVGERDYEMFSGGEAFRVNFAIRLALSQVLARRAGARLQTLVIDEGFGSQDVQGRQRLVEAINLVRDDFEKILVITHLEELKEVFPTRIEVEKTAQGSQLEVI